MVRLSWPPLGQAIGLVAVLLICWVWVILMARDMYGPMTGASAWMMRFAWDWPHLFLLWAMWSAMMIAMTVPSALPSLVTAWRAYRQAGVPGQRSFYLLAAGYAAVWLVFSAGITVLQRLLARAMVVSPMMEVTSPVVAGVLLVAAGLYQWSPLKRVYLAECRDASACLPGQRPADVVEPFRLGVAHGTACVGSCWLLMLLLFAGGVMSLPTILVLTAIVFVEKVTPFGRRSTRLTGVLFVVAGLWIATAEALA